MKRKTLILAALLAVLVAACRPQNEVELTLVAQNVDLKTQIAAIYETATVDADQLQITLEYMNTQVAQAQGQNNDLRATLVARGTEPAAITNPQAQPFTPASTAAANSTLPADPQSAGTPVPGQTTGGQPTIPPTPTEATEGSQPALTGIVMSTGVGDDDCAQGVTSTFTTSTQEIYVVATASNITPGTTLLSRWFRESEQVVTHDFTPDFNIDGNCIWFFMDQADAQFTPGTWSVQLEVNGAVAGAPVTFTITE